MQLILIMCLLSYFFVEKSVSDSRVSSKSALAEYLCVLCLKVFLWTIEEKYLAINFLMKNAFNQCLFLFLLMLYLLWVSRPCCCYWAYVLRFSLSWWKYYCYFQTVFLFHYWIHNIHFLTLLQLIHSHNYNISWWSYWHHMQFSKP